MPKHTTVLVTGASRGIGRAIASRIAHDCEALVLVGRDHEALDEVAADLLPVPSEQYTGDLRNPEDRHRLTSLLAAREGPISGFVHCAGAGLPAAIQDLDSAVLRELFELHVTAFVELAQTILPGMRTEQFGRIVAVSSLAPLRPRRFMLPYSATKAALRTAVQCMAAEVICDGVTVNAISPGGVDTALGRSGRAELDRLHEQLHLPCPPSREGDLPHGRRVEADDVARAVAFLLAAENEVIAGQDLTVAGTHVMR